jgi:polyhydroxyalkanoate synthesis regulator phasin
MPEEHKQRLRQINTGRKHTDETKQKMSDNSYMKGKPKSEEFKEFLRLLYTGRKNPWNQITNRDPEKIRKTAEKHTGMKRSEEACKNISESLKGKNKGEENHNFKGYYITPLGKFSSLDEASKIHGLGPVTIWQRCTKLNNNQILKFSLNKDKTLKLDDLGKTWKDIGWSFESDINKNKVEDN